MAMTPEQFAGLVKELEAYSRRDAPGYRVRVAGLAALGYAYIGLILTVALGLFLYFIYGMVTGTLRGGSSVLGRLIVLLGFLVWTIVRALWVPVSAPEGIPLTPRQAPALFALLDELTTALDAPRFTHVYLVDDFNAGVIQVPRLGFLPFYTNYLLLGLPLLLAISPEQLRAILGHEFGHLAGGHSRFNSFIYRLRTTWVQLQERMMKHQSHRWIFGGFLNWYAPFFNAYSFVLARQDEYDADRTSARIAGPHMIASALLLTETRGRWLQSTYWKAIQDAARTSPTPNVTPFSSMGSALRQPLAGAHVSAWIDQALHRQTDLNDTHPALTDRLTALDCLDLVTSAPYDDHPLLAPPDESAATALLGASVAGLAQRLDALWTQGVAADWEAKHKELR
ncbi:MAG: M48 family metallopeptidase, partial [bacterium]